MMNEKKIESRAKYPLTLSKIPRGGRRRNTEGRLVRETGAQWDENSVPEGMEECVCEEGQMPERTSKRNLGVSVGFSIKVRAVVVKW